MKDLSNKKILLVDDEPDFLDIIQSEFQLANASVVCCGNFGSAIEFLNQNDVDVIISDKTLPTGNGLMLLEAAKKKSNKLPLFILMTGSHHLNSQELKQQGCSALYVKPFDAEEMVNFVIRSLN